MINLLKYRAGLIAVMFGLFGGALSKLLEIDEMTKFYTALSSLIGLVISLLVSFLLKGKWSNHLKNNLKIISIILFAGLILTAYLHTKYFMECTFSYPNYDGSTSYYVKGYEYTPLAQKYKASHPEIKSDTDLIYIGFSPAEIDMVWTQESIQENLLKLITSYSLLVIFFVSIVSLLMEVLIVHYSASTSKTMQS